MTGSTDFAAARRDMVDRQLRRRGISDPHVLAAMGSVPREAFLPARLAEFAYADTPLPIEAGQTISQPYVVAWMLEALELKAGDSALEIGAGSGYAAAVLSRIAKEVYAVERHAELARLAQDRCRRLGYDNVHILHGDGTLGWPDHAPYAGIVVAAGGPDVPPALREQLAVGGCLVMPVAGKRSAQDLIRVRRLEAERFEREDLGVVRFVPLIGSQGWRDDESGDARGSGARSGAAVSGKASLRDGVERLCDIESADLSALIRRIGDSRVVLLGESTHGTSEFYRMRARVTRELITRCGFTIVAVEADWPDAAQVDRHIRGHRRSTAEPPFRRFPTWMWRNEEFAELVTWLRAYNGRSPDRPVNFYGLDLYSLYASVEEVLRYLDEVDPAAAGVARWRYGCLTPWERDPALYGRAALTEGYALCENAVSENLRDLLDKRLEYDRRDGSGFLDAAQNARLVANAERYYRVLYRGAAESWNLRDRHMFETLESVLEHHGKTSKAIVWEHNSHIGDARATEMSVSGELNVGQLAREALGSDAYLVGFGTHTGTVAAASDWGGKLEIKRVRPSDPDSFEHLFHGTGEKRFLLPLREPLSREVPDGLREPRLERAIGVIYRPETELASHYFTAELLRQFDEYVWFDESSAIAPLGRSSDPGPPETWPFGI